MVLRERRATSGALALAWIALALSSGVWAADAGRLVKVTGHAEVVAAPDTAEIEFEVSLRGRSLEKTEREFGQKQATVEKAVASLELPAGAVRACDTRIRPLHGSGRDRAATVGYQFDRTFTVELTDLGRLRRVLDALVAAGVNSVTGIEFRSAKEAELEAEALCAAAEMARTKAEAVAKTLDCRLGRVMAVHEDSHYDKWEDGFSGDEFSDDFGGFDAGGGGDFGEARAPASAVSEGRITISTQAIVTFELID